MKEKRKKGTVTLEFKGKQYILQTDFPLNEDGSINPYWWTEGNGDCDCNRSMFILNEYPNDFHPDKEDVDEESSNKNDPYYEEIYDGKQMVCGEKIKLISYKLLS